MIDTFVFRDTGWVVTVKVALVLPAGMVTLAGTEAVELPDRKVMRAPPAGAGPLSLTVPVELDPPRTDVGLRVKEDKAAGLTVNCADEVAL